MVQAVNASDLYSGHTQFNS